MKATLVTRQQLITLVQGGAVKRCLLNPVGDRWYVQAETHDKAVVLAVTENPKQAREFKSLDAAGRFIRDVGIGLVTINLAGHERKQKTLALS